MHEPVEITLKRMKLQLADMVGSFNDSEDHDLALSAQAAIVAIDELETQVFDKGVEDRSIRRPDQVARPAGANT